MVEKLFGFGAVLWFSPEPNPLFDRPIDHVRFGRGGEDLIEGRVGRRLIDFFHPQIALQSLSPDRSLLDAQ